MIKIYGDMTTYSKEQLRQTVLISTSYSDTLRKLGLAVSGSAARYLKRRIRKWNIDTSHFNRFKKEKSKLPKKPLKEILKLYQDGEFGSYSQRNLKRRLLEEGVLPNHCMVKNCPTLEMKSWLGVPVTLHLDHVNGNHLDNRLGNLRILCIMCHSHTDTWGTKRLKKAPNLCLDCKTPVNRTSKRCGKCATLSNKPKNKGKWPPDEVLIQRYKNTTFEQLGREIGVTGSSVRKRLKKLGQVWTRKALER